MRRMLTSTALAVIFACGGTTVAMSQQQDGLAPAQPEIAAPAPINWAKAEGEWASDDIIGVTVVNDADENLGDVELLLIALISGEDEAEPLPETDQSAAVEGESMPDDSGETQVEELVSEEPATEEPTEDFAAEEPATEEPTEDLAAEEPATEEPTEDFAAEEPATEEPTEDLAAEEPATEESDASEELIAEEPMDEEAAGEATVAAGLDQTEGEFRAEVTEIVIGVGGFLGIGEKHVAIPFERFEFFTGDNGERKIVLSATKEQLEAMPEYVSPEEAAMMEDAATEGEELQ